MKVKLLMLMLVAAGATALVASAQEDVRTVTVPAGKPRIASTDDSGATTLTGTTDVRFVVQDRRTDSPYIVGRKLRDFDNTHRAVLIREPKTEDLARQLSQTDSDLNRKKYKDQLVKLLGEQFDLRQKQHEKEIKQLEDQIEKLKDLVEKREANRKEIVAHRLDQIVRESQGLGW